MRSRSLSRNRRGIAPLIVAVIVVVVAVVVVVGGLFAAGVLKLNSGGGPSPSATFDVTFSETGLASGTSWTVTLGGTTSSSTTASIVFHMANGTYSFTVGAVSGYTASPASGSVTVNGAAVTKGVTFTPQATYAVTFTETGLSAGTSWTVSLGGTPKTSTSTSISFSEPNGSYSFTVGAVSGYTASPSSGTVTVAGAAVTESITFTAITPGTYAVTFTETGLPSGTSWSVTLNGATQSSSTASISFTEPNGSYSFTVGAVSGYTARPSSGTVTVAGTAVTTAISFTSAPPSGEYPVTFDQTGLPGNESWTVLLLQGTYPFTSSTPLLVGGGGQGASFELTLPNGNYFWAISAQNTSYVAAPAYGNLTVASSSVTVNIVFTVITPSPTHYSVTFTETGLPGGSSWSLNMNGTPSSAPAGSPIVFSVPNGTYYYNDVSTTATGYGATVTFGDVTVDGHSVTVTVDFVPMYTVTFTETGLSGGTYWEVTLNGSLEYGNPGGPLTFTMPNGNYPFTASATNYSASPASGTVTVSGAPVSKVITFTPIVPPPTYTVTFTEAGLPGGTYWGVSIFLDGVNSISAAYGAYGLAASVSASVPNGNYSWVVALVTVSGYVATPSAGGLTVHGAGVTQSLSFAYAPSEHSVYFAEYSYWFFGQYGDPNGTSWSVTLAGGTQSTTGMFLVFNEPNGTYSYTITPPAGYLAVPGSGTFTINSPMSGGSLFGSSASVFVGFLSTGPSASASGSAASWWGFLATPPVLRAECGGC